MRVRPLFHSFLRKVSVVERCPLSSMFVIRRFHCSSDQSSHNKILKSHKRSFYKHSRSVAKKKMLCSNLFARRL